MSTLQFPAHGQTHGDSSDQHEDAEQNECDEEDCPLGAGKKLFHVNTPYRSMRCVISVRRVTSMRCIISVRYAVSARYIGVILARIIRMSSALTCRGLVFVQESARAASTMDSCCFFTSAGSMPRSFRVAGMPKDRFIPSMR